ncbi:MAG: YchF/TatD family DNA exonuclease [Deinococcus-Thermus bacterium]|jgi:TatD DNase family protein|nr:YchF/TatD family DNA exonuclease [Deinococcota bacterium]
MIDSHCHLDRVPDLGAALDNDLRAMVTIGTDPERCREAVRLAGREPRVFAAVGLHPNEASRVDDDAARAVVAELAEDPRVVAIGETGFDTHWKDETLEAQRRAFDWHAGLARELSKPLILHVRDGQGREDASLAAAEALAAHPDVPGVLHCFAGHAGLLRTGLDLGWMVSFAGNLTYKNATSIHDAARQAPDDRLMVETDAPFLAPVPHRGERTLPAWVRHTAKALADLRDVSLEHLEPVLDANATRFYRLPPSS